MSTISTVLTTFPGRKPGDGICLFFWDANYEFYPAGIGSSLGYCNFNGPLAHNAHITGTASAADLNPIRGSYVGIGFDVKGDFSTTNNAKPGYRITNTDTANQAITSCTVATSNQNSICVRSGQLSSYTINSVTPNLSTYPLSATPESEKYGESPPLILHQNVTSRDDVVFQSVRVRLQNEGKHVRIEVKSPLDGKYYTYHVADLPNGLGAATIPYTNPTILRCGLSFATSDSIMNCEIKNFSVHGKFVNYEKISEFSPPLSGSSLNVTLSSNCP